MHWTVMYLDTDHFVFCFILSFGPAVSMCFLMSGAVYIVLQMLKHANRAASFDTLHVSRLVKLKVKKTALWLVCQVRISSIGFHLKCRWHLETHRTWAALWLYHLGAPKRSCVHLWSVSARRGGHWTSVKIIEVSEDFGCQAAKYMSKRWIEIDANLSQEIDFRPGPWRFLIVKLVRKLLILTKYIGTSALIRKDGTPWTWKSSADGFLLSWVWSLCHHNTSKSLSASWSQDFLFEIFMTFCPLLLLSWGLGALCLKQADYRNSDRGSRVARRHFKNRCKPEDMLLQPWKDLFHQAGTALGIAIREIS